MGAYDGYKAPESAGLFHKFDESGKKHTFRFLDEPYVFTSSFQRNNGDVDESIRYGILVWNCDLKRVQILQLPVTAFKKVMAYDQDPEYGDPTDYNLSITRTGKAPRVQYEIIASPRKSEIPDFVLEAARNIDIEAELSKSRGVSNVRPLSVARNESTENAPASADSSTDEPFPSKTAEASKPQEGEDSEEGW